MTERRVVFQSQDGLCRIHGTIAASSVPSHVDFTDAGRRTCATLATITDRLVLYRECEQPLHDPKETV